MDKPSKTICLLKRHNRGKSFFHFSIKYSTAVLKRSCRMLVYNNLISQVLSVVSLGQCLSIFEIERIFGYMWNNDGSIMILNISDMSLVW